MMKKIEGLDELWFNSVGNGPEETEKSLDALIPTWWQQILRWRPWPRKQRIVSHPADEPPHMPFPSLETQEKIYRRIAIAKNPKVVPDKLTPSND